MSLFEFALVPEIVWATGDGQKPSLMGDTAFIYSSDQAKLYVTDAFHATIMRKYDVYSPNKDNIYGRSWSGGITVYKDTIPMPLRVALKMAYGPDMEIKALGASEPTHLRHHAASHGGPSI